MINLVSVLEVHTARCVECLTPIGPWEHCYLGNDDNGSGWHAVCPLCAELIAIFDWDGCYALGMLETSMSEIAQTQADEDLVADLFWRLRLFENERWVKKLAGVALRFPRGSASRGHWIAKRHLLVRECAEERGRRGSQLRARSAWDDWTEEDRVEEREAWKAVVRDAD